MYVMYAMQNNTATSDQISNRVTVTKHGFLWIFNPGHTLVLSVQMMDDP